MNRREFIALQGAALFAAGGNFSAKAAASVPKIDRKGVKPRNRKPYSGLDWSKAYQINGTTHIHQHRNFMNAVMKRNIRFLTLSNYYPSAPAWPLLEQVVPQGLPVSDWPVVVNGKRTDGPFDWNKIVSEWESEIPEDMKKTWPPYPFKKRGRFMEGQSVPADLLEGPNAEHHTFFLENGRSAGSLHLCAPGSTFISGTFDARNRKQTGSHGYCSGSGEFWGTAIDRMIEALICKDGGGITINHPTWTRLNRNLLLEILDWDPRVLGIEVLESTVNSEHYWDWVLATGRQCFGFFVPDHNLNAKDFGVCVLVVPERTAEACLKAYRNGDFYGAAHGLGELKFTSIKFNSRTIQASTDKPADFEIITARGVRKTVKAATSVEWECPKDDRSSNGPRVDVFARVRATAADGCGERLFSQPYMLI